MIRRGALLAGIAAIAAPAASGAAAAPAPVSASRAFTPPTGPVLVSRTLVRSLPDGKEVRSIRRYLVWFRPVEGGFQIDGELREVVVDVPPLLEQFAAIERNRTEPGLFPVRLDSAGRILRRAAGAGTAAGDGSRARAAALGHMMLSGATLAPEVRNQANVMLGQVAMAAAGQTAWPADLFNPAEAETRELRPIALPAGERGQVEIVVRSTGLTPGHLPGSVERVVVTELEGTRRTSRETWTFSLAQP